ncbi:MAG: hypothetical protein ABGZ17_16510, partial [Planctomycetaceae bacterium]
NTDQNFIESNSVYGLLGGSASAGYPQIFAVNDVGLGAVSLGVPLNYVETAVIAGEIVTLDGSGFDQPVVDLFTSAGKIGPLTPLAGGTATKISVQLPNVVATGAGALRVVNTGRNFRASNAVSVSIGAAIRVDSVTQDGNVVTVNGAGFSTGTVINLFNKTVSGTQNLGGFNSGGVANVPLTLVSDERFTFLVPPGTVSGPAYIRALNSPFISFSSSGSSPGGAFTISAG